MKIAILSANDVDYIPYISYYTDVFDKIEVKYDYIYWQRNGTPSNLDDSRIVYTCNSDVSKPFYSKLLDYYHFSRFVVDVLNNNKYDFVVVHTIQLAVFLENELVTNYKKRYCFDLRDYSPLVPFVKRKITRLLSNSSMNVISSKGFLKWLPDKIDYILGHNISVSNLESKIYQIRPINTNRISILTIGALRDYSSNLRIIYSFANRENYFMYFVGDGVAKRKLEYKSKSFLNNISFTGRYMKSEEPCIVQKHDVLNILLPRNINDISLMSNRFYLALVHKKPIIVNSESYHARYVEKYKLGIIIYEGDDIYQKTTDFLNKFDSKAFEDGCNQMLQVVRNDVDFFTSQLSDKINKINRR